jgi:PleD family two-component response regulator
MGISSFPSSGIRDVFDIFELTDIALYEAKNSGRNKVCICPGTTFIKEKTEA